MEPIITFKEDLSWPQELYDKQRKYLIVKGWSQKGGQARYSLAVGSMVAVQREACIEP